MLGIVASNACIQGYGQLLISRRVDRTGERYFHLAVWWWAIIVGYIIALATMSTGGRYFSLFLMSLGYCGTYDVQRVRRAPISYK